MPVQEQDESTLFSALWEELTPQQKDIVMTLPFSAAKSDIPEVGEDFFYFEEMTLGEMSFEDIQDALLFLLSKGIIKLIDDSNEPQDAQKRLQGTTFYRKKVKVVNIAFIEHVEKKEIEFVRP